jgi:hypothetical protein
MKKVIVILTALSFMAVAAPAAAKKPVWAWPPAEIPDYTCVKVAPKLYVCYIARKG